MGDITRRLIIRYKGMEVYQIRIKPEWAASQAWGLALIFLVMSLKRNAVILNNLDGVWIVVVPVVLYYLLMYVLSVLWGLFLIRRGAMAGEKAVVIIAFPDRDHRQSDP